MSQIVHVMHVDTDNFLEIEKWLDGAGVAEIEQGYVVVGTVIGNCLAHPGDLILRTEKGNIVYTPKMSI